MREIKFRAWDKEENEMIDKHRDERNDYDEYWADVYALQLGLIENISKDERFVLMQFTGLHDKNGKEIFEGDVVKDKKYTHEVRFGEECVDASDYETYSVGIVGFYMTNYLGEKYEFDAINSQNAKDLEIIGNIYENPELLKS